MSVKKRFPDNPANPDRLCWGCDRYCAADNMLCGNGSDRTQHPVELFGPGWREWGHDFQEEEPSTDNTDHEPHQTAGHR